MSGIEGPREMSTKKKRVITFAVIAVVGIMIGWNCAPTEESRLVDRVAAEKVELARVEKEKRESKLGYAYRVDRHRSPGPYVYAIEVKGHEYVYTSVGGMTHSASCKATNNH